MLRVEILSMNLTICSRNNSLFDSNLPQGIKSLISSLQNRKILNPETARQFIINAQINTEDLLPWADFKHPVTDSYGRQLVYDGGHFEIMVMSWVPGDFSAIHDHGSTQWGAVQCFGSGEHWVYKFKDNRLFKPTKTPFLPGTVIAVNHELIHQMGNRSQSPFLSLHVYGCNDKCDSITGNARIFDLWEESIQYTDGGVFFCLNESKIKNRSYGIQGDRATTLHHHQCMSDRINKILSVPELATEKMKSQATCLEEKISLLSFTENNHNI